MTTVDPSKSVANYPPEDWRQLCDDAEWLLDNFGELASRLGWSAADLFGVWPEKPHWGGIADRLRGCRRSLVIDADRSCWRSWNQVERFNRDTYPDPIPFWLLLGTDRR